MTNYYGENKDRALEFAADTEELLMRTLTYPCGNDDCDAEVSISDEADGPTGEYAACEACGALLKIEWDCDQDENGSRDASAWHVVAPIEAVRALVKEARDEKRERVKLWREAMASRGAAARDVVSGAIPRRITETPDLAAVERVRAELEHGRAVGEHHERRSL